MKTRFLLNAGETTNFIYEIVDFKPTAIELQEINSISSKSKIKDRLSHIIKVGGKINFVTLENAVFKNNLILIDSLLPNILGELVKLFFTTNVNSILDLSKKLDETNPIKYDKQFFHSFYEYKIKRFLTDVALGMMPSKVWGGVYDATGGYLIVKEDGDILCYHIYNRNQFENYLFHNTKLDTASSTRHEFGKIYEEDGLFYFKLNLLIRFTYTSKRLSLKRYPARST